MIRVSFKSNPENPNAHQSVEYPGCDGAMPFAGDISQTAIVKINKESPTDGPHEVVAILPTEEIVNIEEIKEEAQ